MKRRKNLERAIVLGLILSTGVYGTAWAAEIEEIILKTDNNTYNEEFDEEVSIGGYGILVNQKIDTLEYKFNLKSSEGVIINKEVGDTRGNGYSGIKIIGAVKANFEGILEADSLTINNKIDKNNSTSSGIDIANGMSDSSSYDKVANFSIKTKNDVEINDFSKGINIASNGHLLIEADNITINAPDTKVDTAIYQRGSYQVPDNYFTTSIYLNAQSNINLNDYVNGFYTVGDNHSLNVIAGNNINIVNEKNIPDYVYDIDTYYDSAIRFESVLFDGTQTKGEFNAGNNIKIEGYVYGVYNTNAEVDMYVNNLLNINKVRNGIYTSGKNNTVLVDEQEENAIKNNINQISADKTALNAEKSSNITLNAATNNLVGAEESVVADSSAKVNVNGEQNYIANSFADEQTGNGSYALHSLDKAEITVVATANNTILGDTEAVLADEGGVVNISGKNNYIANSSSNTNGIATLSDKENYALHAVKGSTINVTSQDGGINNIQSDGFRTIFADSASDISNNATININGAVNIINKNALDNVEQEKIAVVAANESNTSDLLEKYYKKGIVNINLNATDTLVDTQGNFISGNRIVGSVIAGKNGIVNINSNLSEDVSTFSRSGDNSKGSIAVYGNVMAGNNGELNLDLGDGGYLSGRVDDYQDADLKDGIGFFNPEFSREVTEAGTVNLTMGEGSTWNVTGQSWVTKLDGSGTVDMRNGAADETSHAVHIGELSGSHTFVMDLDTEHSVSDMLFIKDKASGEQKLWINSINGYDELEDGDRLRFATVNDEGLTFSGDYTFGSYENAKNGIMLMDNGVKNNAFKINSDDYQLADKENEGYNGGTEFDEVKPGDKYVDDNYENATNWFLEKYSAGDETSDAGKTIINMSKVNYNNAIYMDRLNKRLGEVRYINPEEEQGMWVRIRHDRIGKDDAFRSQNTMYEMGYDEKQDCDNGERRVGFAIDYMDGKAEYSGIAGDGDVKRYGLWLYDTWLGDKGHYTDYVLKWGHLENDFDIYTMTRNEKVSGDYSNNVFSASAEYGKKNDMGSGWYFEPQAQLQFARVTGADYVTSQDTKVSLDGINSLIGRAGFRLGRDLNKNSTVYIKADLLHEFLGDQDITATDATGTLREEYENEGTWYDVGFGFATALGNSSYAFMDFEKSFGNDNDETYQINAGVQWTF